MNNCTLVKSTFFDNKCNLHETQPNVNNNKISWNILGSDDTWGFWGMGGGVYSKPYACNFLGENGINPYLPNIFD